MTTSTTNTAYLVGLSARVLKCTVTHDPNGQTVNVTGYNTTSKNRDAYGNWVRELLICVRGAINTLGLPGGFTVTFDHKPPTNARPDLAIVAACLHAVGRELGDISRTLFLGGLSYSGRVVPMRGVLPILETIEGFARAFVPQSNAIEAGANTNRITCMTIENVHDLIDPSNVGFAPHTMDTWEPVTMRADPRSLSERTIEHLDECARSDCNVLIVGENAWTAAKVFHGLLPRLSGSEARAVACVHSTAGYPIDEIPTVRPFRAPHYSCNEFSLTGKFDQPGEASLAAHGTLVLDHVTQFKRAGLERLKSAVRTGVVMCCRKDDRVEWPAKCRIVATVYPDEQRFLTPERVDFLGDYVRVDV